MTGPPFVFEVDSNIYVSPNVQRPPTAAELLQMDAPFSDPLLPTDALHLRYADNRYPYLGFTMVHARYHSTVLKPLNHTQSNLPIKMRGGQYCLDPAVVASWDEVELNLRTLASKLFARYRPLMPPDYDLFPFPGDYGYARGRHTEDGMRRAAMRARKAFAPLIALCSFAIAMTPEFTNPAPAWVQFLSDNGAHPRWLQEFTRSPIADFSKQSRRIGCVVQPKSRFLEHIPKFVMANVPVWLLWNHERDYTSTRCDPYRPSQDAVAAARARARYGPAGVPAPFGMPAYTGSIAAMPEPAPDETYFTVEQVEQPPEPERESGQRKGETLQSFMQRRAEAYALRAQKETAIAYQTRMQRIAAAETYSPPGKRGAKVYEWELVGKYWTRKVMSRGYIEQQWGNMARAHLKYDSFANEWDYCELFDPSAGPPPEEDYDDLEEEYFHASAGDDTSHEKPHSRSVVDSVGESIPFGMKNLEKAYVAPGNRGEFTLPEPLDVILRLRYGFRGENLATSTTVSSWHHVRKTLSDTESPWKWPHFKIAVETFVRYASSGETIAPELWDLGEIGSSNTDLVVKRVTNGSRVFYRLAPRRGHVEGDPEWDLLVQDPITAIECLRRSSPSLGKAELVNFFLQTGRSFTTRMPIFPAPPPTLTPRLGLYSRGGLGERHAHYEPDTLDYKGYEFDRSAFLAFDRGRAALQEGGIVWRLAVEHFKFDDVLEGPVDVGSGLYERFDGDPVGGWDDELADDELDLVCGVYKIFTSEADPSSMMVALC